MKLYDYYRSTSSYRVRIALNLKQISYETFPINLIANGGEQHSPEYRALNPQELVPTLDENGHILTQSLAIIEYIDELNPLPPLLPHSFLGKAHVRSLALMIACEIHPLNNLRTLNYLKHEFHVDEPEVIKWYHHWLQLGFGAIEERLQQYPRKNSVCYGNDVTLADICLVPQVYNAHRYHFSMEKFPLISEINNYCLTLQAFKDAAP